MIIRLDKLLSAQLNISRNDVKKLLSSGTVSVNGITEKKGNAHVDTETDSVKNGCADVIYKKHIYIMLNKPQGVVSASESPGDVTVVDLVPDELKRRGLFPAGRLDKDTTGFVLITDDGEFAHNILSPSRHVAKTYIVETSRLVEESEFELFFNGMNLGDIVLKPASLVHIPLPSAACRYEITICEGRYHQIKRMFASTGNKVVSLRRIKIGGLLLDEKLAEGECRELTKEELELIKPQSVDFTEKR